MLHCAWRLLLLLLMVLVVVPLLAVLVVIVGVGAGVAVVAAVAVGGGAGGGAAVVAAVGGQAPQPVSPVTLVTVWRYLGSNLPAYSDWARESSKTVTSIHQCNKAALLIDPRYSEVMYAVAVNMLYNLGPECWNLYIYTSFEHVPLLKREFAGIRVEFRNLTDSTIRSSHKVSKWLMDPALWGSLHEDWVLVFQTDSVLLQRDAMKRFLLRGYPFLGAYSPGVGKDTRTPKGVGINGGLSLRSRAALLHCLGAVTPEMVNKYRSSHGMVQVPHNPAYGLYMMEDIYYYHALEMLDYPMPTPAEQAQFSVQESYYPSPLGLHGYDKGWYLTTAQVITIFENAAYS